MRTVLARGDSFGISLGLGAVSMVAATAVAAAMFPGVPARLAVVALWVAAYAAAVEDLWAVLSTAAVGYLLFDGFLVNRHGELAWTGTTSVRDVAVLALAVGVGLVWRWIRAVKADAARDDELHELLGDTESIKKETHDG
jgi:hypothetical protein